MGSHSSNVQKVFLTEKAEDFCLQTTQLHYLYRGQERSVVSAKIPPINLLLKSKGGGAYSSCYGRTGVSGSRGGRSFIPLSGFLCRRNLEDGRLSPKTKWKSLALHEFNCHVLQSGLLRIVFLEEISGNPTTPLPNFSVESRASSRGNSAPEKPKRKI